MLGLAELTMLTEHIGGNRENEFAQETVRDILYLEKSGNILAFMLTVLEAFRISSYLKLSNR